MRKISNMDMGLGIQYIQAPRSVEPNCRPGLSALAYVLSDVTVLTGAWAVAAAGRAIFDGELPYAWYLRLWPMLVVCIATFATRGLYPEVGISPVEEFRHLTVSVSMVFASLIVFTFFVHQAEAYSRLVFFIAWLLSILFLPLSRAAVRQVAGFRQWWGNPVVILGAGPAAGSLLRVLRYEPTHGIRVKGVFGDSVQATIEGAPVLGTLADVHRIASRMAIRIAIVALPDFGGAPLSEIVREYGKYFSQLLIIPDMRGLTNLCVDARGLGHLMTIRVRQNLLRRGPRACKRMLDITLAGCGGIALLPFIALTAIAIKLTSRGPIFYGHARIGKGQRPFKAWKFRTMVVNADCILAEHLARDPLLRLDWETSHKLRKDPRVTPIGRLLRKWSIDELPQLWNVVRGEMSLIGPRPIVTEEVPRYADRFEVYTRVLPGITGLWQVSGRSNTDYQRRVDLDSYYVQNWSPWLDLYVLARTVRVVLDRKGAY
jgi:Undecaprenyl-phosphate galactose phosphotransferase WbaP